MSGLLTDEPTRSPNIEPADIRFLAISHNNPHPPPRTISRRRKERDARKRLASLPAHVTPHAKPVNRVVGAGTAKQGAFMASSVGRPETQCGIQPDE